jgi:hypothetical protein
MQNQDHTDLRVTFQARKEGYEVLFGDHLLGLLRMQRRPLEGPEALAHSQKSDFAEIEGVEGQWILKTADVTQGLEIVDRKSGASCGRYRRLTEPGKTLGELVFEAGGRYLWRLIEADPNQVTALATSEGKTLIRFESANDIEAGRIEVEDASLPKDANFSLLLLTALYLYLRPVPGAKAAVPSR